MPIHVIDLLKVLQALQTRKKGQCSLDLARFADLMMEVDPLFAAKIKMENEQVLTAEEYLITQIETDYFKHQTLN